ncbi:unnamed protein product [Rotaria sordida]|uniref:Transposase n=2 Tax=Rotaria sordida TaxID=392033 RepID=A0A815Q5A9_9BILA|nr:unnamed protein product [Rotaria sordida]CAF3885419.1 unnamed protein product [Rotaria sordida]
MAPKTKEHSLEFRELVIKRFQNGDSEYDIAKDLICSRNTIHSIIAKYKKTKCIGNIFGRGRKRKTTSRVDQSIQRKIKQDRRKSASSVRLEIEKELGVIISSQTVRRRLHEVGLYGRTAQEYDPVCTVPTVKHGGGNVKVWGCFAWNGVGNLVFINGNMTGEMYKDILKDNLIQSATKLNLGNEMLFQHDNDPKHTARIVKNWLDNQGIKRLIWSPFSPDMNPIEHLWDELERRMKKHQLKNENELRDILQAEWEGIGQNITNKLVESVPSRLYECLRMKGHPTRY